MLHVILKQFETADEVRSFEKGKFEVIHIGGMTLGRASYEPGWKWSDHVGKALGQTICHVEHVGIVVSGRATAAMEGGKIVELKPGDIFHIPPGHDSWVVGDEPYGLYPLHGRERLCAQSQRLMRVSLMRGVPTAILEVFFFHESEHARQTQPAET